MTPTLMIGLGAAAIFAYSKLKKPTPATPAGATPYTAPNEAAPVVQANPLQNYPTQIGNLTGSVSPAPIAGASGFFSGVHGSRPSPEEMTNTRITMPWANNYGHGTNGTIYK